TGNDVIFGGDAIGGDTADDTIEGGSGNDTVTGGTGNDVIFGGDSIASPTTPGDDSLDGGSGSDTLSGGAGNDTVRGGTGNDVIFGGDPVSGTTGAGDTLEGGSGNDTVTGGTGNDVIFGGDPLDPTAPGSDSLGGGGNDTLTGGAGNDTLSGGTGNDVIYGGDGTVSQQSAPSSTLIGGSGGDSVPGATAIETDAAFGGVDTIAEASDTDFLLTDKWLVRPRSGGDENDRLVGIDRAALIGGTGNNILDARQFRGSVTLVGGSGSDTLLGAVGNDRLDGGLGDDSLAGGRGDDEYAFGGPAPGADTVDESPNAGKDTVNLLGLTGPVALSLDAAGAQPTPGGSVTLLDPVALENLTGTPYADALTGNSDANVLTGAGGQDTVYGGAGDDYIQAGVTQLVYLDFDMFTTASKRVYVAADRDAVQARLEADYSPFGYRFTQVRPAGGAFATVFFNRTPFFDVKGVPQSGGIADEVDWRNLNLTGTLAVDVNGFLGYTTRQVTPTTNTFVALSATIAAHELGHLAGLRHLDSFGPIGSGIYIQTVWNSVNPNEVYPGPRGAVDTPLHIMSSPASTRTELIAAAGDAFFGERESVKLAFFDTGRVTVETTAPHKTMATAQPLPMADVYVPNTLVRTNVSGQTLATQFNAQAANVVGSIQIDPATLASENDYYRFDATAGDFVTIEILSRTLARVTSGIDSILRVYNAAGQPVDYYGMPAVADDHFENQDAVLIDLLLPQTGTYYIEVDTFATATSDVDTGDYELFVYRSKATASAGLVSLSGDLLVGEGGTDTLVASSGRDQFFADGVGGATGTIVAPPAQPPVGTAQTAFEGQAQPFQLGGFGDAAANGPWAVSVNWGDGSPATTFAFAGTGTGDFVDGHYVPPNQPHTFPQNGGYSVTVKVTNAAGLSSTKSFSVTVANVAPDLAAPGTQSAAAGVTQDIDLGTFTDPAVDNP
ncbi:MAG TPA: pre-peptidase C-terminal domain-containing protein, partial [Gemmataceae bacterium]|nr:pre-peptidase C-terminal domain-containing protein [Gemmataceae bacterium]